MSFRTTAIGTFLLGVTLAAAGCAAADRAREAAAPPKPKGFTFEKPADPSWSLRKEEQSSTTVVMRKESRSTTHTAYVLISLGELPREPKSHDDFVEIAGVRQQSAPYPVHGLTQAETRVVRQDQWCVRNEGVYSVRRKPAEPELRMVVISYRCLHPGYPGGTLDFMYSERGLPQEIDPKLAKEGERILDGVRIDFAPIVKGSS